MKILSNKYIGLLLFAVLLFGSGYVYEKFYRPPEIGGVESTGNTVEISIRVLKDQWKWDPEVIRVEPGDKVRLRIFNEDSYVHGFAIDVFGVNRRLSPKKETLLEFNASLAGKFNFYCSVPCGDGHYDQVGTILVGDKVVTASVFSVKPGVKPAYCSGAPTYN